MSIISSENTPFKKPKILTIPRKSKLINQDLITTIQNLTKENSQLKEALADLENDLKEKDETIEECQKIINKLKQEYEQVVKEFEFMEKSYNELLEESNKKTLIISEPRITKSVISLINNKNENQKFLYKQTVNSGKKMLSSGNIRLNDENNLNSDIINDFQKKNINYATIIQEKDKIIKNLNLKISESNNSIKNQKEFKEKNKITDKIIDNIFDNKNANFSYEELFKQDEHVLTGLNFENPEEFYISNNLKNELMKTELFSGLIREYHFTKFLKKFLEKVNVSKLIDLYKYIINYKNKNIKIIQENNLLKRENKILYKNIIELKEKINRNNANIKNKCSNLIEKINNKSNIFSKYNNNNLKVKNNINNLNDIDIVNKKVGSIQSPRYLRTISTLEKKDYSKNGINNFIHLSNTIINKDKMNNTAKINRNLDKNKRKIDKKEELDNFFRNNSLQFNTIMTEGNHLDDKLNYTTANLLNKTQIQNNNINYKKNIFKLKNEFNNNIVSRSYIQDKVFDSLVEIKRNKQKCIKIKTGNFKNDSNKNSNFDELKDKRNDTIKIKKKENIKNVIFNNSFFTSDFFVDLIFKINEGIFIKNELNKYKQIYDLKSYENIYLTFKKTCNELKNMTDELNLKMNKSYYLTGNNFSNKTKNETERKDYLDSSFKVFNTKIINLKKIESEFMNMNEYIKNYLISQEATIQLMYKLGKNNIKFEPIDKLFNLFEDCFSYRINEMNESIRFIRKLLIKLFKNQINCLFISFEYKFK